jgi:hypothetical protein
MDMDIDEQIREQLRRSEETLKAYIEDRVYLRNLFAQKDILTGEDDPDDPWTLQGPAYDENYRNSLREHIEYDMLIIGDGTLDRPGHHK